MTKRCDNETHLQAFFDWGRKAGWPQTRLAEEAMVARAHLNQVLHGIRSGGNTWRRIVKVLPAEGISLLKQCASWNKFAEAALKAREDRERLLVLGAKCREPETIEIHQ